MVSRPDWNGTATATHSPHRLCQQPVAASGDFCWCRSHVLMSFWQVRGLAGVSPTRVMFSLHAGDINILNNIYCASGWTTRRVNINGLESGVRMMQRSVPPQSIMAAPISASGGSPSLAKTRNASLLVAPVCRRSPGAYRLHDMNDLLHGVTSSSAGRPAAGAFLSEPVS